MRPAASAALRAVTAGLADVDIEVLPPAAAATAHERLENHTSNGRLVLAQSTKPGPGSEHEGPSQFVARTGCDGGAGART
jgi:hypothetical protein